MLEENKIMKKFSIFSWSYFLYLMLKEEETDQLLVLFQENLASVDAQAIGFLFQH